MWTLKPCAVSACLWLHSWKTSPPAPLIPARWSEAFAKLVQRAIFTFVHIPSRINPRDVPKVTRIVDQPVMVTALAAAATSPELTATANFILSNMSQRMAQSLREEIQERGKVTEKDGESAQSAVISGIRALVSTGELVLTQPEE
jgi:flagellar motor switch protein FliG